MGPVGPDRPHVGPMNLAIRVAFQTFQAAILVNWGYIGPLNGGAVVVYILVLMLQDIVEHGHFMPWRWGAEFVSDPVPHGKPVQFSQHGDYMVKLALFRYNPDCIILAALQSVDVGSFAPYDRLLQ